MLRVSTKLERLSDVEPIGTRKHDSWQAMIVTYLADVIVHPLKCLALILESIIQTSASIDLFSGEKAVGSHPVIKGDYHDVVSRCLDQASAVIISIRVLCKATSLYIKVYR